MFYICSMLQGCPISTKFADDGLGDRFWYWLGASGRRYIHSIYAANACPPLPGAVFIAVQKRDRSRAALAVGRFPSVLDASSMIGARSGIDEFHVHLLARDEMDAQAVLADLNSVGAQEIAA